MKQTNQTNENGKFYSKSWFIILMLFLFFPVGAALMWHYLKFNKACRIIITGFCFFFLLIFVLGYTVDDSTVVNNLKTEIAELNKKNSSLDRDAKELELKIDSLNKEISKLKEENSSLKDQVQSLQLKASDSHSPSSKKEKSTKSEDAPGKIELISYAQTVLEDYYPSAKFPADKNSYNCPGTNLRYKIEGEISTDGKNAYQPFYVIIEFTNTSYSEYDLISASVGKDTLYK